MKRKSMTTLLAAALIAAGWLGQEPAQAYEKWVEFTIVRITQPATGSEVPKQKTITLKCVAALDIDVVSCDSHPAQVSDPLTFTWSADGGSFTDDSGPEATWTAPSMTGEVTITVTASDDGSPVYANDTNRSHSITLTVVQPGIVYVDKDATGGNNGTSWANAYTSLLNAIGQASPGSELWVAEGTYKPDGGARNNVILLDKNLKIYGGFASGETALYQRDVVANETILSGDIGTVGSDADNSYHVVGITNSSAVLDGFTLTKARGFSDGGGAYVTTCSPTLRNCTFKDNIADGSDADGGGMHCYKASPTVINCVFVDNEAGDDGGGLCNKNNSDGTYINCAFYSNATHGDNSGKSDGGGIFNTSGEKDTPVGSDPVFVNCVIAGNYTVRDGGGECTAEVSAVSNATYLNCTFYGNTAGDDGGAVACKDGCTVTLKNCILWGDSAVDNGDEIWNSSSTVNVTYSDVQGGYAGTGNINSNPYFAKTSDLDGADNRWLTFDDGLRIQFHSPCVDEAHGDAKDSYTDAGANERDALGLKHIDIRTVANGGAGAPAYYDMGAYEAAVEHAIFISVDGLAALYLDDDTLMGSASPSVMPKMKRIRDEGMWTYNARCDYFNSETTPNHMTMLTGRPVSQVSGWPNTCYHGCTYNLGYLDQSWTVHEYRVIGSDTIGNPNVSYMPSVYDIVHDRSGTTAEYAGKDKFIIHEWSYDLDSARGDQVTPPNNGYDKIDTFEWTGDNTDWNSSTLVSKFISGNTPEYDFNFVFLHLKGPDKVGHQSGWNSTAWDNCVKDVDLRLGTVLSMVESSSNKAWYGNTVIVLTADHGGYLTYGHGSPTNQYNYTIPFGVWGHLIPHGDAYTYSDGTRVSPGTGRPTYTATNQPIRHADGVDLALNLMGMPSIDGASITGMGIGL